MTATLADMSFAEFHAKQEEIRFARQKSRVRYFTREINKALAAQEYKRVAHLVNELKHYSDCHSWED